MSHVFDTIKANPLFSGLYADDFDKMACCMEANSVSYKRNHVILLSGEPVSFVGIVLNGSVQIARESSDGKQMTIAKLQVSEVFGEVFACAGISHSPVTVLAAEDCEILFLNYKKLVTSCISNCAFHSKLIQNMLHLMAKKNLFLNQKIDILSKRTIRERLLVFFEYQRGNKMRFIIPYNREQLASYLCVERSAMSAELGKMKKEGLIQFHRNEFIIRTD